MVPSLAQQSAGPGRLDKVVLELLFDKRSNCSPPNSDTRPMEILGSGPLGSCSVTRVTGVIAEHRYNSAPGSSGRFFQTVEIPYLTSKSTSIGECRLSTSPYSRIRVTQWSGT